MASDSNTAMIKDGAKFKQWLEYMPIFMVDNVTSTKGNLNNLANQYIKEFNQTL